MDTCVTSRALILKKSFSRFALLCLSTLFMSSVNANPDIRVGMSAAFSGLNARLGQSMKKGIELGFNEANINGGIQGRKLRLISKDDAYEPVRAANNMRALIEKKQVLAILGNTGTPTAVLTAPIANQHNILMFGAYTGAGLLRKSPPDCCIYNYRASYKEETEMMVNFLLGLGIKANEIAFFTQRDSYGDSGYKGATEQLHKRGYEKTEQLVHGRYRRNTLNVEQAVADLLTAEVEPKAVIMVGSYAASAKFIKLAREEIPSLLFLNISFTGSMPLLKELKNNGEGVIVTQVVPNLSSEQPIVKNYLREIARSSTRMEPDFISLEGYIVARLFIEAAKKVAGDINRQSLLEAFAHLEKIDIGLDFQPVLNEAERQASHKAWMTQIRKGHFVEVSSKGVGNAQAHAHN